jgi:hypothetical protein
MFHNLLNYAEVNSAACGEQGAPESSQWECRIPALQEIGNFAG